VLLEELPGLGGREGAAAALRASAGRGEPHRLQVHPASKGGSRGPDPRRRREAPTTACGSKEGASRRLFFPRAKASVRLAGCRRLAQDRLWLLPSSCCGGMGRGCGFAAFSSTVNIMEGQRRPAAGKVGRFSTPTRQKQTCWGPRLRAFFFMGESP
jgi:hypothetical protein